MHFITIVIIGFLIIESLNVFALYFFPDSKLANSVGIFTAWEKSKSDPEIHCFVRYLVNWVAGTKLIFILLLVVILLTGDHQAQVFSGIALAVSITTFFWRLFPLVRKMDQDDQIEPKGYSTGLGWMILVFILVFIGAVVLS